MEIIRLIVKKITSINALLHRIRQNTHLYLYTHYQNIYVINVKDIDLLQIPAKRFLTSGFSLIILTAFFCRKKMKKINCPHTFNCITVFYNDQSVM